MNQPNATIRVNVDPANPGQFFACCGLLELADRLWRGAEGWFETNSAATAFLLSTRDPSASLSVLLREARSMEFAICTDGDGEDGAEGDDTDDDVPVSPIEITKPITLLLDWWSDKSLKPWAGTMREREIMRALLGAIDEAHADPFNDAKVVFDAALAPTAGKSRKTKRKKREPFCFDSRTGASVNPLDVGFSPDKLKMQTKAYPVVEAMCFVGLQRCRPEYTDVQRVFHYYLWQIPLAVSVARVAACGLLGQRRGFRFENAFRTDQRKHKGYLPATLFSR